MLLDPEEIASAVIQKLFMDNSVQNMMSFVQKQEWDIYTDFEGLINTQNI